MTPDRPRADRVEPISQARPPRSPEGRAWRRRLALALAVAAALAGLGRLAWPTARREYLLRLAERAVADGRLADAEARLRPLILERPEETRPRLLRVEVARRLGRIVEAEQALHRAVELGLPVELGRREFALIFAGQDFPKAEGSLRRVLKEHPADREVHQALAAGLARAGRWKEAVAAYSAWLDRDPDRDEAQLGRARAHWEDGRWDRAEADFRAILARDPSHFRARISRADCLLNDAKLAEAEPDLASCRRLAPDRPEPLVGLSACASERGDFDEAETLLNQALDLAPRFAPALAAQGKLQAARGRDDLAIATLERLALLEPADESNHRLLAQLYRRAGDLDRARDHEARIRTTGKIKK